MKRLEIDIEEDALSALETTAKADLRTVSDYVRIVLRRHLFGHIDGLPPLAECRNGLRTGRARRAIPRHVRNAVVAESLLHCRYCAARLAVDDVVIDHFFPVAKGGTDDPANLVVACIDCNAAKDDRTVTEFVAARFG